MINSKILTNPARTPECHWRKDFPLQVSRAGGMQITCTSSYLCLTHYEPWICTKGLHKWRTVSRVTRVFDSLLSNISHHKKREGGSQNCDTVREGRNIFELGLCTGARKYAKMTSLDFAVNVRALVLMAVDSRIWSPIACMSTGCVWRCGFEYSEVCSCR